MEASEAGAILDDSDSWWQVLLEGEDRADAEEALADELRELRLRWADLTWSTFARADLSGASLADVDLTGVSLRGANLSRADLRGAALRGADLSKAELSYADLSDADLTGAYLPEARLIGAILNSSVLCHAILSKADLRWADLRGADLRWEYRKGSFLGHRFGRSRSSLWQEDKKKLLQGLGREVPVSEFQSRYGLLRWEERARVDLWQADLSYAFLSGADLTGARLSEAILANADLSGATLCDADLERANLTGATLAEADLCWVGLKRACLHRASLDDADLFNSDLRYADLSQAKLCGAELKWACLESANLEAADLSRADLDDARLRGAVLDKAILRQAKLNRANLSRARLREADLSGTDLTKALLGRAILDGATLTGACLQEASLISTNLCNANLAGARLDGADLSGARLADATLVGTSLVGVEYSTATVWPAGFHPPALRERQLDSKEATACAGSVETRTPEGSASARPTITIDLSQVESIVRESDEVRDMLIGDVAAASEPVEPTKVESATSSAALRSAPPVAAEPSGDNDGVLAVVSQLDEVGKRFLAILKQNHWHVQDGLLRRSLAGILLEPIVDHVNSLARDQLGDILVVCEEEVTAVNLDFRDQLDALASGGLLRLEPPPTVEQTPVLPAAWRSLQSRLADYQLSLLRVIVDNETPLPALMKIAQQLGRELAELVQSVNRLAQQCIGHVIIKPWAAPPYVDSEDLTELRKLVSIGR